MHKKGVRLIIPGLLLLMFVHLQSCIMDEYNIDRMNYQDEEWEFKVTAPLFSGELLLGDLVNFDARGDSTGSELYLEFSRDSILRLPATAFSEPHLFLDKFYFLIADEYRITEGKIRYEITNGSPLPFNLQLVFYNNALGRGDEIVLSPPVFSAAQEEDEILQPVTTVHEIQLSSETFGLVHKNRVGFVSWFDNSASSGMTDTIGAHNRIKMKVILSATINGIKDEED